MLAANGVKWDTILQERGRIFVNSSDPKAAGLIAKVFGVVSVSPVDVTGATIEEACEAAVAIGQEVIKEGSPSPSGQGAPGPQDFTSQQIGRLCGDAVF